MYGALRSHSKSFMGMGGKSILDAAMLAALADGEASDDEIWGAVEGLRELGGPFEGLSDRQFERLVAESFERLEGYGDMEEQIAGVARQLRKNEEQAITAFAIAYAVLRVDEDWGEDEDSFLEEFANALGLDEATVQDIIHEVDAGFEEEDEEDEGDEVPPANSSREGKRLTSPTKPASGQSELRPALRSKKKESLGVSAGTVAAGAMAVGAVAAGATALSKPKPTGPVAPAPSTAYAAPAAPPPEPPYAFSGATPVDTALKEFNPDDFTVKLCCALFGAIPLEIQHASYGTLAQAAEILAPGAGNKARKAAEELASSEAVITGLKVVNALDMADTGIAAFSGLKSVFGLLTGQGSNALETDAQQGVDAVLKLLALAYFVYSVYPGDVTDRVKMFYATPSGKALLTYYAAVEVGMPFADNALVAGGSFVSDLFSKHGPTAAEKLGGLLPAGSVSAAQGMMGSLLAPVDGLVQRVSPYAKTAAQAVSGFLPTAMNVLDKAAGAAATAIDAMPVYRYLGARVLAESCVLLASRGL
ncbi:MAG: TerB family tellurite resistance protein [Polyangiaceae bacterium]|nr:TerB family tellurite resistance protein [Polyangiaceae bacterium]